MLLSIYNLVMLSLTPLPEMLLTWLVELFTWFSCLVLRRNQKIHSLLIKYHWLIHWSTMENSMVTVLVMFLREENSSLHFHCEVVSFGACTKIWNIWNIWIMEFMEFMDKVLCRWLWLIVKWFSAKEFMWTFLIPYYLQTIEFSWRTRSLPW